MDKSKLYMVHDLVTQIEAKLGWGKGTDWSNRDFEKLSEQIFTDTKKRLSVTTLKRIWGRAERVANPSSGTLDILSEYLGYKNWREFVNTSTAPVPTETTPKISRNLILPLGIGALVVIGAILAFNWPKKAKPARTAETIAKQDFAFKSRAVSQEIPNSVVFEYDASAASDSSKIEIQQSWDSNKRITVAKEDSIATCIYYYPGFFESKLVVDGTIVKENDVFIETNGWLGTLNRDSGPIYLADEVINTGDEISITADRVAQYNLDPRTTEVTASMYLVQDFGELYTDDFQLSMQVRNTFEEGLTGCQWAKLYILYDSGAIGFPLAKKGCASNFDVMAFGEYLDGKKTDLSAFGVNFKDFVLLKCTAEEGIFEIHIDGELAYTMQLPETVAKIRGFSIHFEGAGELKNVELGSTLGMVYSSASPEDKS